jgi:RNA polymerase sigma-70 factor, ECF subfamily
MHDFPSTASSATGSITASTPFDEVVRSHSAFVYRVAYSLTKDRHEAEDLTQDVFVRVFGKLAAYRPGNFNGWLYRITVNLFRDQVRRRPRVVFEPLHENLPLERMPVRPGPEQVVTDRVLEADLQRALEDLCPDNRAVIVLRDIDGLSYDEIAAALGVNRGTVGSRICRGRAQLRAALTHRAPQQRRSPGMGHGHAA